MSSNMKRRPWLFRSTPPSPRTPSVTRMPLTLGGQIMPVGWNWTNSMSWSAAPAWYASVWPSPVYSQLSLAIVGERARDALPVGEQAEHRALHVHVDALMDAMVLEGSNHLQPGAVAD